MAARSSERSGRRGLSADVRRRGGSLGAGRRSGCARGWTRRRGTLPGMVRTGATFADAAAEYLRYIEHDRGRKPSTVRGYRSAIEAHLLPVFGSTPVELVTTVDIERWIATVDRSARGADLGKRPHALIRKGSLGIDGSHGPVTPSRKLRLDQASEVAPEENPSAALAAGVCRGARGRSFEFRT